MEKAVLLVVLNKRGLLFSARATHMIIEVDIHMVLGTLGVLVLNDAHMRATLCRSSNWERDTTGGVQRALVVLLVVLDKFEL